MAISSSINAALKKPKSYFPTSPTDHFPPSFKSLFFHIFLQGTDL